MGAFHQQAEEGTMEQDYLKKILLYSPKSGVFYWIVPPPNHSELLGEIAGAERISGGKTYHIIQIDGEKWRRSHLAFLYMTGSLPDCDVVDHIDGNSTNDKWDNLRIATYLQNSQNRKVGRPGRELPMGVKVLKSGRFSARITVDGNQISIGSFDTAEEAGGAYMNARRKYYGSFA